MSLLQLKKQAQIPTIFPSNIMKSPGEYPQLTREEFLKITNNSLSTGQWVLPADKACFHTSGINYSAYIVESAYLFSLYVDIAPDGSAAYDICPLHYADGEVTGAENDPLLFENFLK